MTGEYDSSHNSFSGVIPNPSQGSASISFSVVDQTPVSFSVFDITGRLVLQTEKDVYASGNHNLQLEIQSEGIYFCKMKAGGYTATQRFVVIQ